MFVKTKSFNCTLELKVKLMGLKGLLLISLLATTAAEHLALAVVVGSDVSKRIKRNYDFEHHPQHHDSSGEDNSFESNTVDYGKGARYSLNDVRPQSNNENIDYTEPDYDEMPLQQQHRPSRYHGERDQVRPNHFERNPPHQYQSVQHSPPHHGGSFHPQSPPGGGRGHRRPRPNYESLPYSRGGFRGMTHSEAGSYGNGGGHRPMGHSVGDRRGHGGMTHPGGIEHGQRVMAHAGGGGHGHRTMTHPRRGSYGGENEHGPGTGENNYIGGRDHGSPIHAEGNNYEAGRNHGAASPHSGRGGSGYGDKNSHGHQGMTHGGGSGHGHGSRSSTHPGGQSNYGGDSGYGAIAPPAGNGIDHLGGNAYEGGGGHGTVSHGHGHIGMTHPTTSYASNLHMGSSGLGLGHTGVGLHGMTGYGHTDSKKDVTAINAAAILAIQQVKALDRAASYSFSGGGNSYGR